MGLQPISGGSASNVWSDNSDDFWFIQELIMNGEMDRVLQFVSNNSSKEYVLSAWVDSCCLGQQEIALALASTYTIDLDYGIYLALSNSHTELASELKRLGGEANFKTLRFAATYGKTQSLNWLLTNFEWTWQELLQASKDANRKGHYSIARDLFNKVSEIQNQMFQTMESNRDKLRC